MKRLWRARKFILHKGLFPKGNPSQVIFRSLTTSEIPGESRTSQSCDANSTHVDSPSVFHAFSSILHENIHATRVVRLSVGGLVTTSKNNFTRITLRIRLIWGINSLITLANYSRISLLLQLTYNISRSILRNTSVESPWRKSNYEPL